MPLACIFHPTEKMQVVPIEDRDKWIATGLWFSHPNEAKKVREHHEEQIRRRTQQGCSDSEHQTEKVRGRTQRKKHVREESSERTSETCGNDA